MSNNELSYLTAWQASDLLRARKVSAQELVKHHLSRAEKAHAATNCFTEFFPEKAIAMATKADEAIKKMDKDGFANLCGVPLVLKEESKWQGSKNTSACLVYKDMVDEETDVHVQRLLDAGVIPVGKTTTPEFCILGSTVSKMLGVTTNPWNHDITPGGSSGGTAAALAAGAGLIGTGSDIGGSIRIPASCCGIVGYKPPHGRIPELSTFSYDYYSHVGPMARSVMDVVLMMQAMAGHHYQDQNSYSCPPDYAGLITDWQKNNMSLKGVKVALSMDLGFYDIADDVRRETMKFVDGLRDLGAQVDEVGLAFPKECNFYGEAHVVLTGSAYMIDLAKQHPDKLSDYTLLNAEWLKDHLGPHDMARANEVTFQMAKDFANLMTKYDIFVCPTNRKTDVAADDKPHFVSMMIDGKERTGMNTDWYMTVPFNMLSRCPVLSLPSGFGDNGAPTGVQVVGKFFDEISVLRAGLAIEKNSDWFSSQKRPNL